ncbi:DNA polymerase family A-domain-containing protein [Sporodiniella umbellata]|nr:DNA polymerase family A-domain-containing protein [Sporodiniella umbellata]
MIACRSAVQTTFRGASRKQWTLTAFRRFLTNKTKINPAHVQLLSPLIQEQIFEPYPEHTSENPEELKKKEYAKEHLKLQDIWGKSSQIEDPIEIKLPKLLGNNLEEHFIRIGLEQSEPYLTQCEKLAQVELPPTPRKWKKVAGWTRYGNDGKISSVDYPLEDSLVFDVEVMMSEGKHPTIATAVSEKAWYSWTSPYLLDRTQPKEQLIPLGRGKEKIVVGHNVGYDRARIAEEYSPIETNIKYVDTMSLHIAVAGLCSQQRPAWSAELKRRNPDSIDTVDRAIPTEVAVGENKFFDVSALNSLKDVAKFHCKITMDKSQRSVFETGTLDDVNTDFDVLMDYCAKDVTLTHQVYQHVFPKFRKNCPHPVSFAGMLHMGSSFLTVSERWEEYLESSSNKHNELSDMLDIKLNDLAEKARSLVDTPESWQNDPWLSQLDWFVNPRQRKLKGQPKWYKDSYDSKVGAFKISTRSRIAPILLRLKWQGYPLHHLASYGWCFKVQTSEVVKEQIQKAVFKDDEHYYIKVPHKDGHDANCGNPLAKGYIGSFEDKILTSEYEAAKEALELNAMSAYWISSRERILNQFVIWDNNPCVDMGLNRKHTGKYGIILPQMVTMGTITRRAVERTWLTASNAKKNRIGSELKSMVQAPDGYKIVGADVDSEELWISSVIGDSQFGFHGATALGWMTLQGTKSEGTDLHSKTANILGISRDKAKIFNYARIYGAGVKYATSLLLQYSQGMDPSTAEKRALDLYSNTKGEKEHSKTNAFGRPFWHGGSESYMFNALEDIALSKDPRTPILGCSITDALKPRYTGTQFLTSRVNWVVQSSGVDYLHLLIVSMRHLIKKYEIDARFMLSVHDEVRYLTTEKDQHRTALALQISNLWTRALFSYKLGILNLPQSVAFFSAVDVDHVLRKEPNMTCLTPSNENMIPEGSTYSLHDTIQAITSELKDASDDCLLGESKHSGGSFVDEETVKSLLEIFKSKTKELDLDFVKAQMYKNFRKTSPLSAKASQVTERKIPRTRKNMEAMLMR